jgi:transposase
MDKWQERGLMIAESNTVEKNKLGWKVPSQSGNGTYIVNLEDGEPFCTCQHFETTHKKCQHIYAIEFIEQKEKRPDGTEITTKAMRVTYAQDWPVYNEAQTHEEDRFVILLRDLCNGIEQPEYKFGRPRLPLSDVVFGLVFKSYSTMSGRRFTCALKEAETNGLIAKAAHYNSAYRYLEDAELTPLLKSLVEQSASPLGAVETEFAIDSTGFSSSCYDRWYDHKWGKMRKEVKWIKTHMMCGVNTHIITTVEANDTETADAPQLPAFVNTTAKTFTIKEVSADKAYSSKKNLHAIDAVNAMPYIPFKNYCKGSQKGGKFDGLWYKMWHFYSFNHDEFMNHYHKRSNAEAVFAMMKKKFGGSVRSKSPAAQINEVLCKVLCHNICVLIQSIYELGISPRFWTFEAKEQVAPKLLQNYNF